MRARKINNLQDFNNLRVISSKRTGFIASNPYYIIVSCLSKKSLIL